MPSTFQWTNNVKSLLTHALATVAVTLACIGGPVAVVGAAQPPKQPSEYVPIDQLPPGEEMPAAPLLIGAYVFVPVVLFLYLVSLARRMSTVQREIERLEADLRRTGRA
jgi:CcmD family protein